jgi:hypothetical protein
LLLGGLSACGGDDDAGTTTTTATPTTTSTSTTVAPTTSTVAPGSTTTTAVARDEIFGWVRSFVQDGGATTIGIDNAQMFTGEEALTAAREDGVIGSDEFLENDYYIRNLEALTEDFTVSPDVVVTLQACYQNGPCITTEEVDLGGWSVLLGGEEDPGFAWEWYGAGTLPYVFTMLNDAVVEISEVYLP